MYKDINWDEMYENLVNSINENPYMLSTYQKGWISFQKKEYKKGKLSEEKCKLLNNIGVNLEGYGLLKRMKKTELFNNKIPTLDEQKKSFAKSYDEIWNRNYDKLYNMYKKHNNDIDLTIVLLSHEDIKIKNWLIQVCVKYRKGILKDKEKIKKLNDIFLDWGFSDTKYLNKEIIDNNEYKRTMLERMKHILEDLSYEMDGSITDISKQEEIEKEIIKRMWR